jgi:hypothetical protein
MNAFDIKKEETNVDEDVLIEVVEFTESSEVEIAYNDRNERCYLRFSLADLVAHIGAHTGSKETV